MVRLALAAVAAMITGAAIAQTSTQPPPPPLIDWEKTQIKTTDLGHNTYRLEGQGGNITIAVGTDGIIMVDSQYAPLSDKIKAAIKAISPLPVKYLVNTHFHGDHTGGNENFAKDGATIVAHDNTRVRLVAGTISGLTGQKAAPRPAEALPTQTYVGGSIPLMPALTEKGIDTVLSGFALPESNVHSPNERFLVPYFAAGIDTVVALFTALGRLND